MTGVHIVNEIEAMTFAISLAKMASFSSGDVPVGTVIIDANGNIISTGHNQRELIKQLEQHSMTVIPQELRHSRTLGGGFHCVTLDLLREHNK